MNQIIERHEAAGPAFDDVDVDVARLSPVLHAHIKLSGRYHIDPDQTRLLRTRARDVLGIYR